MKDKSVIKRMRIYKQRNQRPDKSERKELKNKRFIRINKRMINLGVL